MLNPFNFQQIRLKKNNILFHQHRISQQNNYSRLSSIQQPFAHYKPQSQPRTPNLQPPTSLNFKRYLHKKQKWPPNNPTSTPLPSTHFTLTLRQKPSHSAAQPVSTHKRKPTKSAQSYNRSTNYTELSSTSTLQQSHHLLYLSIQSAALRSPNSATPPMPHSEKATTRKLSSCMVLLSKWHIPARPGSRSV